MTPKQIFRQSLEKLEEKVPNPKKIPLRLGIDRKRWWRWRTAGIDRPTAKTLPDLQKIAAAIGKELGMPSFSVDLLWVHSDEWPWPDKRRMLQLTPEEDAASNGGEFDDNEIRRVSKAAKGLIEQHGFAIYETDVFYKTVGLLFTRGTAPADEQAVTATNEFLAKYRKALAAESGNDAGPTPAPRKKEEPHDWHKPREQPQPREREPQNVEEQVGKLLDDAIRLMGKSLGDALEGWKEVGKMLYGKQPDPLDTQ
jgi:hypothetical protein